MSEFLFTEQAPRVRSTIGARIMATIAKTGNAVYVVGSTVPDDVRKSFEAHVKTLNADATILVSDVPSENTASNVTNVARKLKVSAVTTKFHTSDASGDKVLVGMRVTVSGASTK